MTQSTSNPPDWQADAFVLAHPELRDFWAAAEDGQLLLRSCNQCHRPHWYPRMHCPFCHGRDLCWAPASGEGRVHSCSVMRRAAQPYVLAYVELAEGVVLMSNIVDCDVDDVRIGQPVRVVHRRSSEGRRVPFFSPVPKAWR